jgi:hypothetical protein
MHARAGLLASLSVITLCYAASHAALAKVTLYVAPSGQAGWSGSLEQPNAEKTDGPCRDLAAARDAIRARRAKGEWRGEAITVMVRGGTYFLEQPFAFGPEDGGAADAPVTYSAYPGETVVVSGGRAISGFVAVASENAQPAAGGGKGGQGELWAADVPEVKGGGWYFYQLFVNDGRRARTRLPKEGFYTFAGLPTTRPETPWQEGQAEAIFKAGEIERWKNLGDVDVVATSLWITSRLPIKEVDESSRRVVFSKKSTYRLTNGFKANDFSRYWLENVRETLDTPGQWYLDRAEGKLYYRPLPGESLSNVRVIAPKLPDLLRVAGTAGAPVRNLQFVGLSFEHGDWDGRRADFGLGQASVNVPAAVSFTNATGCGLRDCGVRHVSTYAVEFGAGCEGNALENCVLSDLGGGGVKVNAGSSHTTIDNCDIGPGGFIHHPGVGVWVGNSGDNRIAHNDIHDFLYTGVSLGWSWGYGPSEAVRNVVEFNHIHDLGKGVLSDMGGIYTLGVSPGTVLRNNLIHDIHAYEYGGWGIYNDEGSTGIVVENNVVYRTTHGGYHQHYGKENLVRNNVFAMAKYHQVQRTRDEEHCSFTFERNIVYFTDGKLLAGNWHDGAPAGGLKVAADGKIDSAQVAKLHYQIDNNLYYKADGKGVDFDGQPLEKWRERGHDRGSLIADPLFVCPSHADFTLRPGSPAERIGFKPIDVKEIGRKKPATRPAAG